MKTVHDLDDAEERAEMAEMTLTGSGEQGLKLSRVFNITDSHNQCSLRK